MEAGRLHRTAGGNTGRAWVVSRATGSRRYRRFPLLDPAFLATRVPGFAADAGRVDPKIVWSPDNRRRLGGARWTGVPRLDPHRDSRWQRQPGQCRATTGTR